MDEDRSARGRPRPIGVRRTERPLIDLRDPDPATGQPEAIIEQHELWMEREPWAKYTGALGGLRVAAALSLRAKRKARGEYVTPHPWFPTLVTTGIIASVILAIALISWLLERFA